MSRRVNQKKCEEESSFQSMIENCDSSYLVNKLQPALVTTTASKIELNECRYKNACRYRLRSFIIRIINALVVQIINITPFYGCAVVGLQHLEREEHIHRSKGRKSLLLQQLELVRQIDLQTVCLAELRLRLLLQPVNPSFIPKIYIYISFIVGHRIDSPLIYY